MSEQTHPDEAVSVTFASLGIAPDLAEVLNKRGITSPFPVQALTIADALAGRDVCGKAKTGSGKILKRELRQPFWAGRTSNV